MISFQGNVQTWAAGVCFRCYLQATLPGGDSAQLCYEIQPAARPVLIAGQAGAADCT